MNTLSQTIPLTQNEPEDLLTQAQELCNKSFDAFYNDHDIPASNKYLKEAALKYEEAGRTYDALACRALIIPI